MRIISQCFHKTGSGQQSMKTYTKRHGNKLLLYVCHPMAVFWRDQGCLQSYPDHSFQSTLRPIPQVCTHLGATRQYGTIGQVMVCFIYFGSTLRLDRPWTFKPEDAETPTNEQIYGAPRVFEGCVQITPNDNDMIYQATDAFVYWEGLVDLF